MKLLALKVAAAGLPLLLSGGAQALKVNIDDHVPESDAHPAPVSAWNVVGTDTLPKTLDTNECSVVGVGYQDEMKHSLAMTVYECKENCVADPKCKGYTYNFVHQNCWLHETLEKPYTSDEVTSGTRDCLLEASTGCVLRNRGYRDVTSKWVGNVHSMVQCMQLCREQSSCVGVTYNWGSKSCHIKDTINEPYDYPKDLSAPRNCSVEAHGNPCSAVHYSVKGHVLETRKDVTMKACIEGCRDFGTDCTDINYNYTNRTCEFVKGGGQLMPKRHTVYSTMACHVL